MIATYVSKEQLAFAIERVRAGAKKAGRRLEDVRLISWVYTSISDDGRRSWRPRDGVEADECGAGREDRRSSR